MIRAVLFDLDDTLLLSPKDAFLGNLLTSFCDFLERELNIPEAQKHLGKAMQRLYTEIDSTISNSAIWAQTLGAAAPHLSTAEFNAKLATFYRDIYPDLRQLTHPDPMAKPLIDWLLANGYIVVIATNPLYPSTAIEQRIEWAELDPKAVQRFTSADNSHFIKPQPQFYEEIMAHIKLEPYEAIMVGDNWGNDIVPAASTGMRTYWINDKSKRAENGINPDGAGTLADFAFCVMEQGWLESLTPKALEPAHIIPRMIGNVGALMGMVEHTPDHFWNQRPDPKEWSPLEVVAHLEESERRVQRPRLEIIAREDNPFLSVSKAPPQPGQFRLNGTSGYELALRFVAERAITISFLESLAPEAWYRPARHSIYGPSTLLEMAAFTTRHDHLHINQFCQTIGKCE